MVKINIAIDGYSSCGKSTLAKSLAEHLGYLYVDSGAMYRAVTLFAIQHQFIIGDKINENQVIDSLANIQISFSKEGGSQRTFLNGEDVENQIRQMEVSDLVSPISAIPEVREKLVSMQREIGVDKGVVMDGRDIGTVVFPEAKLKIFMQADNEIRSKRRYDELIAKGENVTLAQVRKNIEARDYRDTNRVADPLRKADDALVLDNSNLSEKEQLELAESWSIKRINSAE